MRKRFSSYFMVLLFFLIFVSACAEVDRITNIREIDESFRLMKQQNKSINNIKLYRADIYLVSKFILKKQINSEERKILFQTTRDLMANKEVQNKIKKYLGNKKFTKLSIRLENKSSHSYSVYNKSINDQKWKLVDVNDKGQHTVSDINY